MYTFTNATLTIVGLALVFYGVYLINLAVSLILLGLILLSIVGLRTIVLAIWNGLIELEDTEFEIENERQ